MPSVKQGDIQYHFWSLSYGSTWDWTPVSLTIEKVEKDQWLYCLTHSWENKEVQNLSGKYFSKSERNSMIGI